MGVIRVLDFWGCFWFLGGFRDFVSFVMVFRVS